MSDQPASNPKLLGVLVGVVVLAVAVAAVVSSRRETVDLDPNTPEGVIQAFFRASEAKEWGQAEALLSSDLQATCEAFDLANSNYEFSQVVLEDVAANGDETLVTVSVVRVDVRDPVNPNRYEDRLNFALIEEEGQSKISMLPWPFFCER